MTFEPGQTIDGRYLVKQRLGGNLHGSTSKAISMSNDKEVVLKKLHHDSDQGMQQQLQQAQKAQLLSRQCEELLTIDEVSVEEDHAFYVLPFLPARSLKRHKSPSVDSEAENEGGRYLWEDFTWLNRIAKALDYLASQNQIHGDVKPTNILFGEDNQGLQTAYLSDIEIPKPPSTGDAAKAKDEYPGTMAYLAREVFLDKKDASGHSDQFALAVTLYQWLSGELPFKGVTGIEMYKAFQEGCQPISQLCPDLPQPACDAIHRALAESPQQRFESSGDFAAAFVKSLPVRSKPWTARILPMASSVFLAISALILLAVIAAKVFAPSGKELASDNEMQATEQVDRKGILDEQMKERTVQKVEVPEDEPVSRADDMVNGMANGGSPAKPLIGNDSQTEDLLSQYPKDVKVARDAESDIEDSLATSRRQVDPLGLAALSGASDREQSENSQPTIGPSLVTAEQRFQAVRLAARQTEATAAMQFELGQMYQYGEGCEKDDGKALRWYQISADSGSAEAQYKMGDYWERSAVFYKSKALSDKDLEEANEDSKKANEDLINAIRYYQKAARLGMPEASRALNALVNDFKKPVLKKWLREALQQEAMQ